MISCVAISANFYLLKSNSVLLCTQCFHNIYFFYFFLSPISFSPISFFSHIYYLTNNFHLNIVCLSYHLMLNCEQTSQMSFSSFFLSRRKSWFHMIIANVILPFILLCIWYLKTACWRRWMTEYKLEMNEWS